MIVQEVEEDAPLVDEAAWAVQEVAGEECFTSQRKKPRTRSKRSSFRTRCTRKFKAMRTPQGDLPRYFDFHR